jgi:hypothetical protein
MKPAKKVLIYNPEAIGFINLFSEAERRTPTGAAVELIRRGYEAATKDRVGAVTQTIPGNVPVDMRATG